MTTHTEPETRESLIAELAELEANEPACECMYYGDEADPVYCDYHRHDSQWNRAKNRIEAAIERLDYFAARERKPTAVALEINERKVA